MVERAAIIARRGLRHIKVISARQTCFASALHTQARPPCALQHEHMAASANMQLYAFDSLATGKYRCFSGQSCSFAKFVDTQ